MLNRSQRFGRKGEALARQHLEGCGYKIVRCNYRNRYGEIDIIAWHKDTLVFVEVKSRQSNTYGLPQHAVTHRKQKKMSQVALAYLKETGQLDCRARFDVVAIQSFQTAPRIQIVKNAFELAYP